jgi:hypothetical protein
MAATILETVLPIPGFRRGPHRKKKGDAEASPFRNPNIRFD